MSFELSVEHRDIQKAAIEFAQKEFDPELILELDQRGGFPHNIWKKASQLGFIGINYPEEFGGQGLGLFERLIVTEAFCRVDSGIGSALSLVDLGSELILEFGSEEQKKRILIPIAKGEKMVSVAFGESEDENDLSSVYTTFREKKDGYFIDGKKRYVLNPDIANYFITLSKDEKGGLTTLIVENKREGIEIFQMEKIGLRMVAFGEIEFKDVYIPSEDIIGKAGEAIRYLKYYSQNSSLRFLGQALGIVQGAFDRALEYARKRIQFGRRLSEFQIIRHKLAEMAAGIEILRFMIYKLSVDFDQNRVDPKFLMATKLETGRRLIEIVDEALQIFGGYGYMVEQPIEHYFRDTWAIISKLGIEEEIKDSIANIIFERKKD